MTLTQLRYFIHVCSLGSFTRASEQLHVAQSALSRQIGLLEEELGTQLLIRHGQRLDLTLDGAQLLERAQGILDSVEDLRNTVGRRSGAVEVARIGFNPSLTGTLVMPAVIETRRTAPGNRYQLAERLSQELTRDVLDDRLDLALMSAPEPDPALVVAPLFWEYMWLIAAPGSRIPGGSISSLSDIADVPLVQTTADSLPRRVLQSKSTQDRVHLNVQVECDALPAIKDLVLKGGLSHISPQSAFLDELRRGALTGTPIPTLRLVRAAVRRADRPPSPATAAFLKNLERRIRTVVPKKQVLLTRPKGRADTGKSE